MVEAEVLRRQMAADPGLATLNPAGYGRKGPAASGTGDFRTRHTPVCVRHAQAGVELT